MCSEYVAYLHAATRSVREVVACSERKAYSQEEDDDQEMYIKPVLQRVVQF